jgi:hypothetical protein
MPSIVATGTATFAHRGDTSVLFHKPIEPPYVVLLTGDAGFQQRFIDVFAVVSKRPDGFSIKAGDNNSRANVDWVLIK